MTLLTVEVPGSKDWQISIGAFASRGEPVPGVTVNEQDRQGREVSFSVHGRVDPDGRIVAKFPGVGRVDLRFKATRSQKLGFGPKPGCRANGEATIREGVFSGTIELHDEPGLPSLVRRDAKGSVSAFPTVTCPGTHRGDKSESEGGSSGRPARAESPDLLQAGASLDGGLLGFSATLAPLFKLTEPAKALFQVSWIRTARGMTTVVSDIGQAPLRTFSISPPTGAPTEATVEPPSPFQDSAAFRLESPTVASWTGDLRIELPILGEVSLTAPGTWSTLCRGTTCTDTLPPGDQIIR